MDKEHNTDGGKTTFYDIENCKDVDDLSEYWDLRGDEFNCLKAVVDIAKSREGKVRHKGTSAIRDAKKLVYYSQRILKRLEKESSL